MSLDDVQRLVLSIPDPYMRDLTQVMLARALLGVPVRHYLTASEGGGCCSGDADPTYDNL